MGWVKWWVDEFISMRSGAHDVSESGPLGVDLSPRRLTLRDVLLGQLVVLGMYHLPHLGHELGREILHRRTLKWAATEPMTPHMSGSCPSQKPTMEAEVEELPQPVGSCTLPS